MDEKYIKDNTQFLIGETLLHKSLGAGTCVDISRGYINVDFGPSVGIKEFQFPGAFNKKFLSWFDEFASKDHIEEKKKAIFVIQASEYFKTRGVSELVHFTKVKNLKSIIQNGICSIDEMEARSIEYFGNDEMRLDGHKDAVSLSISFPNYKNYYFIKFIKEIPDEYCVIGVDAAKALSLDCAFFPTNAANSYCSRLKWEDLSTMDALERLFSIDNRDASIPRNFTTDPQAEVMIKGVIPFEYVNWIAFEQRIPDEYKYLRGLATVDSCLFDKRPDYKRWLSDKCYV